MNYKEFEIVYYDLSFQPSKDNKNVVFCVNRDDPHGYYEENRKVYQEKYGNMSYKTFKKEYDCHLPELNRRKHRREVLINEFKSHKPENFADIPLDKKLDYLDALCIDLRTDEEWDRDYDGIYNNLVACLWSIQPSDEFLAEERKKLNHFMDVLVEDKKRISLWRVLDEFAPAGNRLFLESFSKAYNVEPIPVNYYIPQDSTETRGGYATPGKWGINIRKDKQWTSPFDLIGTLFHESTHLRQQKMYEEDPEKYRIFTPEYSRIKNYVEIYYGKEKSEQIYDLTPCESHVYYLERHFMDAANDRIYNGNLVQYKTASYMARTLWFDYQR